MMKHFWPPPGQKDPNEAGPILGCPGSRKLGSINGDRVQGVSYDSPTYKWGVFVGVKKPTDPITIDPNFLSGTSKYTGIPHTNQALLISSGMREVYAGRLARGVLEIFWGKTWIFNSLPSLKLTANAPKNGWLEYYFPIGFRPIFRCELLVSGRVYQGWSTRDSQGHGTPLW